MSFTQTYCGYSSYLYAYPVGKTTLLIGIPCVLGELIQQDLALLDTAAEWCVLSAEVAATLGYSGSGVGPVVRLSTRLGTFEGTLERIRIRFPALDGEDLTLEATWFVSADWPGPLVLGWKGCLDRFRFALDPTRDRFYFGEG